MKNIQRKEENLKRAFEKNIAAKVAQIKKHESGIEEEHTKIKAAQGAIVMHNQQIEKLEEEKAELIKDMNEFLETL